MPTSTIDRAELAELAAWLQTKLDAGTATSPVRFRTLIDACHLLDQCLADLVAGDVGSDVADPVGLLEVAARLGVKDRTVHIWLRRYGVTGETLTPEQIRNDHPLPAPRFGRVNGGRAWAWIDVLRWAGDNGHIVSRRAADEYASRIRHAVTFEEVVDHAD